ncbi:MAG: DNA polymerase IV, partial [Acidimicrobiales bacterium]|nr:DNA polymerase IV [Acidimicrobiales bacterium]
GSVGSQRALGSRPRPPEEVDAILLGIVDRVTRRLRRAGRIGRTVVLRLRFADFTRATRSHTMARPTADTAAVADAAQALLDGARPLIDERGITLVGLAVANLADDRPVQLSLPWRGRRAGALDAAVDDLQERFGSGAVTRAVQLGRDPGWSVPMLPD